MAAKTDKAVTCLACGCMCDDLVVTTGASSIDSIQHACDRGTQWLQQPLPAPISRIDGQDVSLDEAIERAAELLGSAHRPLIYGLTAATNETVRAAIALADRYRAVLDLSLHPAQRASFAALHNVGRLTATLGEVRNAADLVVFFDCDPATTHPRFLERYVDDKATKVVIATRRNATANDAQEFIEVRTEDRYQALGALRASAQAKSPPAMPVEPILQALGQRIRESRSVAVIYDKLGDDIDTAALHLQALWSWVRDASRHTRVFAVGLGSAGNVTGATEAVTWQTGYPPPVDFTSGAPEHCLVTLSAETLLQRHAIDAAIIVEPTSAVGSTLSPTAAKRLDAIPKIVINSTDLKLPNTTVEIRTAIAGIQSDGITHRSDNVALPIRRLLSSACPTSSAVLDRISGSQ